MVGWTSGGQMMSRMMILRQQVGADDATGYQ